MTIQTQLSNLPIKSHRIGVGPKFKNYDFSIVDGDERIHIIKIEASIDFDFRAVISRVISRYYPAWIKAVKNSSSQNWHSLNIEGF